VGAKIPLPSSALEAFSVLASKRNRDVADFAASALTVAPVTITALGGPLARLVRHSMTSSAMASTPGGIVRPSVFAVLRLITNSNLVGCSTGKSAGLVPFSILST